MHRRQRPAVSGIEGLQQVGGLSASNLAHHDVIRAMPQRVASAGDEQATLIRGIYVLRKFCIEKKTNIMMVSEEMMQQEDQIRALLYRLLDYRIIHSGAPHGCGSGVWYGRKVPFGFAPQYE